MHFKNNCNKSNSSAGFGMIELLVAIGVMAIVTTVILVRYSSFNSAVLLRSQAYEIALTIREAQTLAVSVVGSGSETRDRYGVYFDTSTTLQNQYSVFRDRNANNAYDIGAVEGVDVGIVDQRFFIRDLAAVNTGSGTETALSDVSVTFKRPNFDAAFFSTTAIPSGADQIRIGISILGETDSDVDVYRTVTITSAGQIEVN